jgi:hypothetical protein
VGANPTPLRYLTDPATGKPKRHHRSRVVGYAPKMRKAEAETILAAELAAVNGGPLARVADGTLSFGEWMRNFYIPMRGANWRPATRKPSATLSRNGAGSAGTLRKTR